MRHIILISYIAKSRPAYALTIKMTVIKYKYCFLFSNYDVIDREYCDESNRFEPLCLSNSTLMLVENTDEAYLLSYVLKHNAYHQ